MRFSQQKARRRGTAAISGIPLSLVLVPPPPLSLSLRTAYSTACLTQRVNAHFHLSRLSRLIGSQRNRLNVCSARHLLYFSTNRGRLRRMWMWMGLFLSLLLVFRRPFRSDWGVLFSNHGCAASPQEERRTGLAVAWTARSMVSLQLRKVKYNRSKPEP